MRKTKSVSTFEREMQDLDFREKFERGYTEFSLSEILLQLMEEQNISVRQIAKVAHISASVIQDVRSGQRKNINLNTFLAILQGLGSELAVKVNGKFVTIMN